MSITAIRGFNDILPGDTELWRHIERCAWSIFRTCGFGEIRLPIVEKTELFMRSIGERSISYGELDRAADAIASIVMDSGLAGGAVALWGVRDASTVAALWGIPRGNATAVPIDPRFPPAEAMRLTRQAGVNGL